MSGTRFMVQWEEHPSHLASRLGQLLEHQTLVDVTLMCNTHTLKVHRAVLAACSPYFETLLQSIFQRQLGQHPLIVLKDMQFSVLKSLIEFMYCGETNVTEDDLGALLQAAKFFQVKGLSSMSREALGIPPPKAKSTLNGETAKPTPKARVVEPEHKVIPQPPVEHNQAVSEDSSSNENLVSRPGPEASADTAQVLLSLSGDLDTIRANQKEEEAKVEAESAAMSVAKAQEEEEVAVETEEVSNAVHVTSPATAASHASQVPPGGYPIYVPGPRKRGRPLKRQMNLIFQEKVMTDAEMALRKEAEASRKALEALQKEMSARDTPANDPPTNVTTSVGRPRGTRNIVHQRVQQVSHLGQTRQVAHARERTNTGGAGSVVTSSSNANTIATAAVNVSNPAAGGTVMTQYMEVLKEAGLPTDVPILMDSGDGSFVTVNEEVLMNIVSGGVIQCHVEEGGNIATLTTGDGSAVAGAVQEEAADVVEGTEQMEAQAEVANTAGGDMSGMVSVEERTRDMPIQESGRGHDMPIVEAEEAVGETSIAFTENETVVQEVEGAKEAEAGETIYMVVEDGGGGVEGQQVVDQNGVPLCKVKAGTVDGKTMYLVTRGATKTMQCAISEGALVVSEGEMVQGLTVAGGVELQEDNKASLVTKVEYEKMNQLPSLDESDITVQNAEISNPPEEKLPEECPPTSQGSAGCEELSGVIQQEPVAKPAVMKTEFPESHPQSSEVPDQVQPSVECQEFDVSSAPSAANANSGKRKAEEDAAPSVVKKMKEGNMEKEEDSEEFVLVLKDDDMDESSSSVVENQTEFILTSSANSECNPSQREEIHNSLPPHTVAVDAVGDFKGKVELTTAPGREGKTLPILQDSDDDIKSSTM